MTTARIQPYNQPVCASGSFGAHGPAKRTQVGSFGATSARTIVRIGKLMSESRVYPAEITFEPWTGAPPRARLHVPGSKSLTNRALIVAALAEGASTLQGALDSDDTRVMVESLGRLGIAVAHDTAAATIGVTGCGGKIPSDHAELFVANSGTSLRFLTALAALGRGTYRLDGTPRMRERPVADLLQALAGLGADARSDLGTGCPPVTVQAGGLDGGYCFVRGDVSSQFLSGLLMALPYARERTTVEVEGTLVSRPYVAMTLAVMESFGVRVGNRKFRRFDVKRTRYTGRLYNIEPDASAASYFFAAAAITGGTVTVEGLGTGSLQGDLAFVDVLEHMGCKVIRDRDATTVTGGPLRGVNVDMNAISDTVMTQAVVALFASGISRIRNVGHIRHKETDRLAALATELRKLGASVDEHEDGLVIVPPGSLTPARIATYDDHRMAMAFALAGLKAGGITILDPGCVAKTYPGFWEDLAGLRTTPERSL
jgi:3-phosphoshikimate 1-carboxyvinyltransferase